MNIEGENCLKKDFEKNTRIKSEFNNSMQWPECFEKSLISCLYYVSFYEEENLYDKLNVELNKMKERLSIEGIETEDMKKDLERLKAFVYNKNNLACHKEIEKMLQNVRTLDINRIRHFVSKIEKSWYEMKDKDIILLMGLTGCGKSWLR